MRKTITALILLLFVFVSVVKAEASEDIYHLDLGERLLKLGDQGADVAVLQRKLKDLNIYKGKIDGIFGPATKNAVRTFQRQNEMSVDGIAGKKTYESLPKDNLKSRMNISREEFLMLARIISGEARGESFKGKVAVGAVIMNRVESSKFPNSIRSVILQEGQFSSLYDGQAIFYPTESSLMAAKAALLGYDPTRGALFFYNPRVATKLEWISGRPVIKSIGEHIFAR